MISLRDIMAMMPYQGTPNVGNPGQAFLAGQRDAATKRYQEDLITNEQNRLAEQKRAAQAQLQLDAMKFGLQERQFAETQKENESKRWQALSNFLSKLDFN
ncbi:MAG: hypothetical protein ACWGQW_02255, partial [bacterium]